MKILVTGSSGMVGSALTNALRAEGHTIGRLVRSGTAPAGDVLWNPPTGELDSARIEGFDALVHLAGASIGEGRWTEARKAILRSSRVEATRGLVSAIGKLKQPPKALVSASAIGYYGDRGEEILTESSPPGNDFLAKLARDWEEEALGAERCGIRTVRLRFGVILAASGGALARMLFPFRMGLGGRLGSGKQWMSWLTLGEAVGFIRFSLLNAGMRGAYNAVAPNPIRNADFTKILARVLHRPAIFPAPAFALRVLLGEMADALLLTSQRVVPKRFNELAYKFLHPDVEQALRSLLG